MTSPSPKTHPHNHHGTHPMPPPNQREAFWVCCARRAEPAHACHEFALPRGCSPKPSSPPQKKKPTNPRNKLRDPLPVPTPTHSRSTREPSRSQGAGAGDGEAVPPPGRGSQVLVQLLPPPSESLQAGEGAGGGEGGGGGHGAVPGAGRSPLSPWGPSSLPGLSAQSRGELLCEAVLGGRLGPPTPPRGGRCPGDG